MSGKERRWLVELELVAQGKQGLVEAARRVGLGYRQMTFGTVSVPRITISPFR